MKDLTELGAIIENEIGNLTYPKSPDLLYAPIKYTMGLQCKRMRPILVLMAHQLFDENACCIVMCETSKESIKILEIFWREKICIGLVFRG